MLICFWDQDKVSTFRVIQSPYPYHTLPPTPLLPIQRRHLAGRILHICLELVSETLTNYVRWSLFVLILLKAVLFAFFCSPTQYPQLPLPFRTLCRNAEIHFLSSFRNFIYPLYLCIWVLTQRIWLIPKFKISFFFSLRKTNFWTHLWICHIQWQKCDCYTTLLFRLKNNKKSLNSNFSRIMALYYAGRIAVPSTSKTTLHDRFTKFMKNRPSKLVIIWISKKNSKFDQIWLGCDRNTSPGVRTKSTIGSGDGESRLCKGTPCCCCVIK